MTQPELTARLLEHDDIDDAARLLHQFNLEFAVATPGVTVLASRLRTFIGDPQVAVLLAGCPTVGIAVVTFRPSVWSDGPTAILEELFVEPNQRNNGIGSALLTVVGTECMRRQCRLVEINVDISDVDARRFYERHGYTAIEPDTGEHALYYHRDLGT